MNLWYEKYGKKRCRWFDGDVRSSGKIAVFVIFQPRGVVDSIFLTLKHLTEHGYAVFLVSNSELSESDSDRLKKNSWKILVRPNIGYDFGGYRDAIQYLFEADAPVTRLILLNDSVWFPSIPGDRTLGLMEMRPEDFVGVQEFSKKTRKFFPSYLLMFTGVVFCNKDFRKFWMNYKLSSNKLKVMAVGERKLSFDIIASGCSSGCILNEQSLLCSISEAKELSVGDVLSHSVLVDSDLIACRARLNRDSGSDISVKDVSQLFVEAYRRRNILGEFPVFIGNHMGIGIIKKNAQPLYGFARREILAAENEGVIQLNDDVVKELRHVVLSESKNESRSHL